MLCLFCQAPPESSLQGRQAGRRACTNSKRAGPGLDLQHSTSTVCVCVSLGEQQRMCGTFSLWQQHAMREYQLLTGPVPPPPSLRVFRLFVRPRLCCSRLYLASCTPLCRLSFCWMCLFGLCVDRVHHPSLRPSLSASRL